MVAVVELEFKGGKRRRIGSFTRKGGLCREGLKRAAVDAKLNFYRNVLQDYMNDYQRDVKQGRIHGTRCA